MQLNYTRTNAIKCILLQIRKTFICSQHFLSLGYNNVLQQVKKASIISQKSVTCQHLVEFGIVMLYFATTVLYLVGTTVLHLVRG